MGYIESKLSLLGRMWVIALLLNALVFLGSSWALYKTGIFTRSWYNEGDAVLCALLMLCTALSIFAINSPIILDKTDDESSSLLFLWLKRKKLEHLDKIKELKK